MTDVGKKHVCRKCGRPYYDLGRKVYACPKCQTTTDLSSDEAPTKIKKIKKTENAQTTSTRMELFEVTDTSSEKGFGISFGTLRLSFPQIRKGWYAVIESEIEKREVKNNDAVIYLGAPPLKGLEAYLASAKFKGVGAVTSSDLVRTHKVDVLRAMTGSSDFIKEELGLKEEVSKSLSAGWSSSPTENVFTVVMNELGFLDMQIKEIVKNSGAGIITNLNKNPFSLVKFLPRLNFQDVDRICNRLHIKLTEEQRIIAATDYYLTDAESRLRHTCLPENNAHQRVGELLSIQADKIKTVLSENKDAFIYQERKNKTVISTIQSSRRDEKISKDIRAILDKHKPISNGRVFDSDSIKTSDNITLSEEQIAAINNVINAPVSVITGGPGSGKTTMVQGLVSTLKILGVTVLLCAPTGRAAKRISETPGLAQLSPSTIHMFLAKEKGAKSSSEFDIMIVDEASMIDVGLMIDLLEAIPKGAGLIFIGDADQLPPVGPGQPFKDLIESEMVSVSRLTGNFRQSSFSDTVKAARDVIRGNTPTMKTSLAESDFVFFEMPPNQQADTILNLYFDLMPAKLKVKPQDIQIISPQRPGDVGVLKLNDLIQYRITGKTKAIFKKKSGNHEVTFYVGDKVIQRKNNYELKVMNGDQGIITRESGQDLMVEFDGVEIAYNGIQRFDLDLAYATTIHSSQGSEYPGVIIPVVSSHAHMLSRNLIYTAITRGKTQVCIVGEVAALEKALAQYQKDFRWSCLTEVLKERLG